jgi:hypothetical protein
MRVRKNKSFNHWAKGISLSDADLITAIDEMTESLYEANLGGNIYKKRISIGSRGKRSGTRTVVTFKAHEIAIFIYGFAKNVKSDITNKERDALKALANVYLSYDKRQINQAIKMGEFTEVQS